MHHTAFYLWVNKYTHSVDQAKHSAFFTMKKIPPYIRIKIFASDTRQNLLHICFPGGSESKGSACNAGDPVLILGLGRSSSREDSPGGGHGNPLQYSCLENPHGQRSLAGYSPCGHKEMDTTEWFSLLHFKEGGSGCRKTWIMQDEFNGLRKDKKARKWEDSKSEITTDSFQSVSNDGSLINRWQEEPKVMW